MARSEAQYQFEDSDRVWSNDSDNKKDSMKALARQLRFSRCECGRLCYHYYFCAACIYPICSAVLAQPARNCYFAGHAGVVSWTENTVTYILLLSVVSLNSMSFTNPNVTTPLPKSGSCISCNPSSNIDFRSPYVNCGVSSVVRIWFTPPHLNEAFVTHGA